VNDLADIVLPSPPSWMPGTIGWLVLGLVLATALLGLAWRAWRHWRANRYRRAALKELAVLQRALQDRRGDAADPADPADGADGADARARARALLALAELLKRTALAAWPRASVAGLSGTAWCNFLQAHAGRAGDAVGLIVLLVDAEYRDRSALAGWPAQQAREVAAACGQWIAGHRAPAS